MANKIAHACGIPGCPNLAYDAPYCPQHMRERALKEKHQRRRKPNYYNSSEWRNLSKQFLRDNPLCELCGTRKSEIAHHIIPRKQGGSDEVGNLMAVCRSCHERIHHRDKVNQRKKYTY